MEEVKDDGGAGMKPQFFRKEETKVDSKSLGLADLKYINIFIQGMVLSFLKHPVLSIFY